MRRLKSGNILVPEDDLSLVARQACVVNAIKEKQKAAESPGPQLEAYLEHDSRIINLE